MLALKQRLRACYWFNEDLLPEYRIRDLPIRLSDVEKELFLGWQQAQWDADASRRRRTSKTV